MSNDPLDETIRATEAAKRTLHHLNAARARADKLTIDGVDAPVFAHEGVPPNAIYTVDELKRKIAESKAKTADMRAFMADEEKRQGELILIDSRSVNPHYLDSLKRVGFGTCHIQQPDGAMKLVSVSIVAPQVDPWESKPESDVMFQRAKAMSNELFGSDARKAVIHDGEGNLIIDDMNAMQPEETARRGMYASWPEAPDFRAIRSTTLIEQYAELQESATVVGAWLRQDLRDLWAIVRGWFGRK